MGKKYSIPLNSPYLKGNELKYISKCIKAGWISTTSSGEYVNLFEKKFCKYINAKYAIACMNGTSALQIALKLAGVKSGDEVIVPSLTFIAPVNSIRYNGADPIFMDSDKYYNLDEEKTIEFINKETLFKNGFTYNKKTSKKISALLPVHVWGNAVNLDKILPLCKKRNIQIVEDASESMGTWYKSGVFANKHSGTLGQLGCFSFNGNKVITTGSGGMIVTNNAKLAKKARYLISQAKDDSEKWIHNQIGYNFRLTNMQAALGVAQLEQLNQFLKKKKHIHKKYTEGVSKIKHLSIAVVPDYANNNHWLNILQINDKNYKKKKNELKNKLKKKYIQTGEIFFPNHLQRPYKNFQTYKIKNLQKMINSSLCLPSGISLTDDEIGRIIDVMNE